MSTIIRAEKVGKQYFIGERQSHGGSLRDSLGRLLRRPPGGTGGSAGRRQEFWALDDVSFSVRRGEVVGIVGRNGAGKSTLLKVLSRITEPTKGRVELYGRVGSLLEVGTGFHPELSGRENVFLNGAILGMSRTEIRRKFDEIVSFAEIEKFIDTPIKHYSSGMYVRLAFAVAAHVEPEVLIVDEVLAVGDMAFQRKCLNKMQDAGSQGRTVLFVSHDMQAVSRLCERVILLAEGRVALDGLPHEVIERYLEAAQGTRAARTWPDLRTAPGNEVARLRGVRVCTEAGETSEALDIRRPIGIEMTYEVLEPGRVLLPNYHLHNEEGVCICVVQDLSEEARSRPREPGLYVSTMWVPPNFLAEGRVTVSAANTTYYPTMNVHYFERDAVSFRVIDSLEGDSARGDYAGPLPGIVRPIFDWSTRREAS